MMILKPRSAGWITLLLCTATWAQYDPRGLNQPAPPAPGQAIDQQQAADALDDYAAQWPIDVPSSEGTITVYQPQMENLVGDVLSARAAVSIAQRGGDPVFGVVWFNSRISTDRISRIVDILDVTIRETRIPDADAARERALADAISRALASQPLALSFDQLLTMLETAQPAATGGGEFRDDAPRVLFVDHPAIKVQYDGEPRLVPIDNSRMQRVTNTPYFVVLDPGARLYYLKGGGVWYEATSPLGPFRRSARVPQDVIGYADASGYKDPQAPLPADQLNRLEIITATEPTELVWTDGAPKMGTVPGTGLLYVTNTDSNVFMTVDSQRTYALFSGRWYQAADRNGPYTYVTPEQLPADFSRIPESSPCADVLAHVPGTRQAQEAVADTYVPQTATVNRLQFDQPPVEYDGDPRFEPVAQGASITYAVNSGQPVVQVDRNYYACYNAVWYVSNSPRGHWDLCTSVPDAIYTIPPSCPIYPVRYVYVYDSTPQYVYCGYTPGYLGCYVDDGVVVYGTGYRYQPWYGHTYYGRPYTFGFGARYNSYMNDWGFSVGLRTGGGSLWVGYSEDSWRRDPWFGYGGYRPVVFRNEVHRDLFRYDYRNRDHDHPDHGNVTVINQRNTYIQNINVYERRKDVRQVDRDRSVQIAAHQQAARRDDSRNDVVADRDGRVFRKSTDGKLEVRESGKWRPDTTDLSTLNLDNARQANARLTPAPEAQTPRVERRLPGADQRPAELRINREAERNSDAAKNDTPAARSRANTPAQQNADADKTPDRQPSADQNAGGQGRARGRAAPPEPDRTPAARPPEPTPRVQENRPAPIVQPEVSRPQDTPRGRAPTPPAADADRTPPARGQQTTPAPDNRDATAARNAARGNEPTDERRNAGAQGNRGDRAVKPSDGDVREAARDLQARQRAADRLRNYQRADESLQAPSREPAGNARGRGRDNAAPDRGRGNPNDGNGPNSDNRGRGN